ncbi:phage protease [Paracoccus sp. DMF-8]|uniref:phage protease n=1 Tax=Paracoccus sp. DMF-8 TaxID=3019445 RepID=UPI0023E854CB|nr:phage protease [Paracoccus sp. DMF-8]MDF3606234.1 phage protease [Paracoccus sp. DMF-8]
MSTREADAKVETALNGGYITPAMVPWATALCRQNPEAFDGFMQSSAPAWAHLFHRRAFSNLPQTASRERADAAAEIAAQLGPSPDALD